MKFYQWGRVENLEILALELDCKVGELPSTYLGLHINLCWFEMV